MILPSHSFYLTALKILGWSGFYFYFYFFFPENTKSMVYYAQCESSFKKWTQAQLDVQTDIWISKRVHAKWEGIGENRHVLQWDIFIFKIDSAYYMQTVLHFYS